MNWVKINFCELNDCIAKYHLTMDGNNICDFMSMPIEEDLYLVSDGKKIDIAAFKYIFHNFDFMEHKLIKNKDIKYWIPLSEIELPCL